LGPTAHPAVANLNAVKGEFTSTLDTLEAAWYSKNPIAAELNQCQEHTCAAHSEFRNVVQPSGPTHLPQQRPPWQVCSWKEFLKVPMPIGLRRALRVMRLPQIKESAPTSIAVFSDGDIIRNQVNLINPELPRGQPLPLGFDQYTNIQYGNDDLLLESCGLHVGRSRPNGNAYARYQIEITQRREIDQ